MADVEIGGSKTGQRGYHLRDIAIVPSRRTRSAHDVSTAWQLDAFRFDIPMVAHPSDATMSPATAVAVSRLGGLGVLNGEGLWTRYDDPTPILEEFANWPVDEPATPRLQEVYAAPVQPDLVTRRIKEMADEGAVTAVRFSPQHTAGAGTGRGRRRASTCSSSRAPSSRRSTCRRARPTGRSTSRRSSPTSTCPSWSAAVRRTRRRCISCAPARPVSSSAWAPTHGRRATRCSASGCRWRPRSPTPPRRAATTSTRPAAATCTSSPTGRSRPAATSPGRWPAAPTRSWSVSRCASPPRHRPPVAGGTASPRTRNSRAARSPAPGTGRWAASNRCCVARPTTRPDTSTSSAHCAGPWPRPATPT